jgi:putative iron-regulated protein
MRTFKTVRSSLCAGALGLALLATACSDDDDKLPTVDGGTGGRGGAGGGSAGGAGGAGQGGSGAGGSAGDAGPTDATDGGGGDAAFPVALADQVLATYKTLVHKTYQLSLDEGLKLQTAIAAFVAGPDAAKLTAAKQAWTQSRLPYNQTDAYRFYDGPIDNEDAGREGAMNGWPLDENYVDYTRDLATAGIINDATKYPELTGEKLGELNEVGGEKNLATGYHAIEFLLWGQDDATPGMGTGKRPFTDFVTGAGATATNQARRRAYLTAVTDLLIEDLTTVRDAWVPGAAGTYGAKFGVEPAEDSVHNDGRKDAVANIIRGLGSLSRAELSGERMTVAYKNRDQEDEHSCFSDTTWLDLLGNAKGIQNVWTGAYEGMDLGAGLEELYKAIDPALATRVTADIAEAVTKLKTLADGNATAPFDVVIAEADASANRTTMLDAMKALKRAADGLASGATALGLQATFEMPSEEL